MHARSIDVAVRSLVQIGCCTVVGILRQDSVMGLGNGSNSLPRLVRLEKVQGLKSFFFPLQFCWCDWLCLGVIGYGEQGLLVRMLLEEGFVRLSNLWFWVMIWKLRGCGREVGDIGHCKGTLLDMFTLWYRTIHWMADTGTSACNQHVILSTTSNSRRVGLN